MTKCNYDFKKDLEVAKKTEAEVAFKLSSKFGWSILAFNDDNKYDVLFKSKDNKAVKVEIKEDFTCARTDNVGLEYSCRGKPSGISVSKADYYFYRCHRPNDEVVDLLIETSTLKDMVDAKLYHRAINGGDEGSNSLNYLFKFDVLEAVAKKI